MGGGARMGGMSLVVAIIIWVFVVESMGVDCKLNQGKGDAKVEDPQVFIKKRYGECEAWVQCEGYDEGVLSNPKDEYSFTWNINPTNVTVLCSVHCVIASNNNNSNNITNPVTFLAATRGTNVYTFEWRIQSMGGYVRWKDSRGKVLRSFTKSWSW